MTTVARLVSRPELLFQKVVAWWQEFRIADFGLRIPQSPFRNPQWVAGKARAESI
jgi:hypothetical protein